MTPEELEELRELVAFLKENEIGEFEFEHGEQKIRLKFAQPAHLSSIDLARLGQLLPQAPLPAVSTPASSHHSYSTHASAPSPAAEEAAEEQLHLVKSPIVGTFYESSSPGAPAFVKVGDEIESGQVLCIVEAMKLMNEIESDAAGEVVKRLVTNGQPVEYGQPLFALRLR
ncbi:MAG TPA: acetyl-CoA carboxylase biotin carboxyl carrier protein [Acidobacteriaceae bacterium]|nr:acetyl-CoA carboxylase biotin carboxyl carrier protein [Acidobacteriaceae bacterium]